MPLGDLTIRSGHYLEYILPDSASFEKSLKMSIFNVRYTIEVSVDLNASCGTCDSVFEFLQYLTT